MDMSLEVLDVSKMIVKSLLIKSQSQKIILNDSENQGINVHGKIQGAIMTHEILEEVYQEK